jgi:hypothetical protein
MINKKMSKVEKLNYLLYLSEAAVDKKSDMGKVCLEAEDPVVFEWWDGSVLVWAKAVEEALAGMDNELFDTALLTHYSNEIMDVFVSIKIVYPKAALDGNGDRHCLSHR